MNDAPELRPCPFCNSEAEANNYAIEAAVTCVKCGASIVRAHGLFDDTGFADAITAWNVRADLCTPIDERVKALEAENARLRGALSIYADVVSDYASESELASDPAYDWLQEDGGDVARAALRDMGEG